MRLISALLLGCFLNACSTSDQKEPEVVSESIEEQDYTAYGNHKIFWIYEDGFNDEDKSKLKTWITKVVDATTVTIGNYPFDLYIHFARIDRGISAVHFGHTIRGKKQSVRFYVNPAMPLEDFLSDWVAPHEISHLSQPFVGKKNKWFSEGYATYMSRQIMINMGYYTDDSFDSLYRAKISSTLDSYGSSTLTHIEISDSLVKAHNYGDMYWGSSSFFFTIDQQLKEKYQIRFRDVVKNYQQCCRLKDKSLLSILQSYDHIVGDTLFIGLMKQYRNAPAMEVMKSYK
ncbi:MAG: hypothetical protein H6582_14460 [Crocinitomicaceae bacterium]|nr:hypothetical protein [Crocinitomicaceae bacterium]